MRITNINVPSYGTGNFMVTVGDPENYLQVNLTDEEADRIRNIVMEIFLSRQKAIARDIETARPLMITLQPETIEEAPHVADKPNLSDLDDDVPF